MPRTYDPTDLVVLPRMDAATALSLASALEAAAKEQTKAGVTLSESIVDARAEMADDRDALKEALGSAPEPTPEVRRADRREDAAIGALVGVLGAWARLAGEIEEGDIAKELGDRLFAEGSAFVNDKVEKEWAIVEAKLQAIDAEGLAAKFDKLGAGPLLAHLRGVHEQYGEAIGTTKPVVKAESPQVGLNREALLNSIRQYVVAVRGSVRKKKPESAEVAEKLLEPLTDWEAEPKKRASAKSGGPADAPEVPKGQGGGG